MSLSSGWKRAGLDGLTVVGILEVESLAETGSGSELLAKGEDACCTGGGGGGGGGGA